MKKYTDNQTGTAYNMIQRSLGWVRLEAVDGRPKRGSHAIKASEAPDSYWFTKIEFEANFTALSVH